MTTVAVRENSKEQIIQTALKLFGEYGYDGTSIRKIATEANVALGLMYNYFSGKEELIREILLRGMQDVYDTLNVLREDLLAIENLEAVIRQSFKTLKRNKEFWRLFQSIKVQPSVRRIVGAEMSKAQDEILIILTRLLKELKIENPKTEALLLFASMDGISNHYFSSKNYPVDEVVEQLINRYKY